MKTIALLATLTLGCLTACAGTGSNDGTSAGGAALSSGGPAKSTQQAPAASGKTAPPAQKPNAQVPVAEDGGGPSPAAKGGTVTIDGTTCTVAKTGLDTGLDGHGWTLSVDGTCPTSFSLDISGDSNAAYPQTSLKPFLDEPAAILFVSTADGNDASKFDVTESNLEQGPTSNAPATVSGTVTVAGDDGTTHTVTYSLDY
jgi:hypothetical protein